MKFGVDIIFFFKIRVSAVTTIAVEREMIAIVDFDV